MKVYEIKITLLGTVIPVYRVLNVPCGITFAKFHKILQKAFGFKDRHLYEFTFKQGNICITNDEEGCEEYEYSATAIGKDHMEQLGIPIPTVSMYKSKEVIIDTLTENAKTFEYTYDFSDRWEHKIELLSIKEKAESYAKVTEYSGNCPPEDIGGTDSYNDIINILKDPTLPEYDNILNYAKELGFCEYDVNGVNEELAKM